MLGSMPVGSVRVDVLGPVRVQRDGDEVDAGPPKQRALLAALALHHGRPVSVDLLGELLWGGHPPADAAGSLHVHVARARAALEPDRAARAASNVLLRSGDAYLLRVDDDALDASRFESAVLVVHAA